VPPEVVAAERSSQQAESKVGGSPSPGPQSLQAARIIKRARPGQVAVPPAGSPPIPGEGQSSTDVAHGALVAARPPSGNRIGRRPE